MKKYIKLATFIPLATIGVGTIVMSGCAKATSISIGGPGNVDAYVSQSGSIDYSAKTNKGNDITKTCNWHLLGHDIPTWISINQQGVLSWQTPPSVGQWFLSITADKDELTKGKLDVTLDVEVAPPTHLSDVTIGENLRGWTLNFDTSDLAWTSYQSGYACDIFHIFFNNSDSVYLTAEYRGGPNNNYVASYGYRSPQTTPSFSSEFPDGGCVWYSNSYTFNSDIDWVVTEIDGYVANFTPISYQQVPNIRPFSDTGMSL